MRIAIDLSAVASRGAGISRYTAELTAALLAIDRQNTYVAFRNRAGEAPPSPALGDMPSLSANQGDKPWRLSVLLAHLLRRPQDRLFPDVDVFHGPGNVLPYLTRTGAVLTLHDTTYLSHPATHTHLNRWYLRLMMPRFLRAADCIIAISESTRRDALRAYPIAESKIRVIYPGVSAHFRPAAPRVVAATRRKYGLLDPFLLYVGTIEPRKNLVALLEAYARLRERGVRERLVIAGQKGWGSEAFFQRLAALQLAPHVLLPGYVPDEDLPGLYGAAQCVVYPALYEGFGLPVAEAMACGAPVVCSNRSSLPEVAGDAALQIDPCDVPALAEAVARVLEDHTLREGLRARGLAQGQRFSWERAAREMLTVYAEL